MKGFNNKSIIIALAASLALGLIGPISVLAAATNPYLGAAATYGILSSTCTDTSSATTVTGDVGFTTPPGTSILGTHTYYGSGAPYSTAGTDQASALSALAAQSPCTFTFASGPINLSTDTTHGTTGQFTPGIYCATGAVTVGGPLSLVGSGTYIFRNVGALGSTAGATVSVSGGASACDVFWTPSAATTLGANTTFVGTVIDAAGISVGANSTSTGRFLAFGGTVTTDTDNITVPTCSASVATLKVIKTVANINGANTNAANFNLHVKLSGTDVAGSPAAGVVTPGRSYSLSAGTYVVSEDANASYAQSFSGDCDAGGSVAVASGETKTCTITNAYIQPAASQNAWSGSATPPVPPLIDVVKVPTPLALPAGSGPVTYSYTLRNVGTVPVTNITMVDDSCSPLNFVSGDTNGDSKLDVSETWVYSCSTTLSKTHTNTVIATGMANGLTATDIANATVVVGMPVVPPLIHVTKVPNPLTLLAGGGSVVYTEKVTNPGTIALSNVLVRDDKCNPAYVFGDTNNDSKLDITETWTYTCQTNLAQTTTNTVIASGQANNLTARDTAIATVIVAAPIPKLPNTGFYPGIGNIFLLFIVLALVSVLFAVVERKRAI